VLTAIAIIPSAPVMVPELKGAAAAEEVDLRDAVFTAAAALPPRWIVVGVHAGQRDVVIGPQAVGTFAGYGADVRIALAPGDDGAAGPAPPRDLPLCVLIAGWVRGQVAPHAHAEVRVYASRHGVDAALDHGRRLRAQIEEATDAVGVLVVADGAHTLTPAAPGGYDPDAAAVQAALDEALAVGDTAALIRLPETIVGRVAYQVLAGLTEPGPRSATPLYRAAPYGVGYFAGIWRPVEATRAPVE
jgi:hypothetical protein